MPMPAKMELANGSLPIDANFGAAAQTDAVLAVNRFCARVWRQTGIFPSRSAQALTRVAFFQEPYLELR